MDSRDQLLDRAEELYGKPPVDPEGYIKAKREFRGTPCCGAGIKGVEWGLACRACWGELDDDDTMRVLDEERAVLEAMFGTRGDN